MEGQDLCVLFCGMAWHCYRLAVSSSLVSPPHLVRRNAMFLHRFLVCCVIGAMFLVGSFLFFVVCCSSCVIFGLHMGYCQVPFSIVLHPYLQARAHCPCFVSPFDCAASSFFASFSFSVLFVGDGGPGGRPGRYVNGPGHQVTPLWSAIGAHAQYVHHDPSPR